MIDERVLAYINMFAVLGTLSELCEVDLAAQELIKDKNISIGISVKNGPKGTLRFSKGKCTVEEGCKNCVIKLPFSSPAKFNGMINGTVTPFPSKGFFHLGFLLKEFTKLTDILSSYLKPTDAARSDAAFMERGTFLMLNLIAEAVARAGNEDTVSRASASYIYDGVIKIAIGDKYAVGVNAKEHHLTAMHYEPKEFTSQMTFRNVELARELFDGKVNAVVCVGVGDVRVGGMISQVDNVNRILDRVSLYLA